MNNSELQALSSQLVQQNVICCVSSLIEGLVKISSETDYGLFRDAFDIDIDGLMNLCQKLDFETAARDFIFDDADAADLEEVADLGGYWSDVLSECVPEVTEVTEATDYEDESYYIYAGSTEHFEDEDEAKEAAIESVMPAIREAVWKITTDYEEICSQHNLDPDYIDVLEHWAVNDWLARKLAEKGEIIGEVAGLTVWGRCTSGQAISIDGVISEITKELHDD